MASNVMTQLMQMTNGAGKPLKMMICNIRESYEYLRTGKIPEGRKLYNVDPLGAALFGAVNTITADGNPDVESKNEAMEACRQSLLAPDATWETYLAPELLDYTPEDHASFAASNDEDLTKNAEAWEKVKVSFEERRKSVQAEEADKARAASAANADAEDAAANRADVG